MDEFPDDLLETTFLNWLHWSPGAKTNLRQVNARPDEPDTRRTFFDLERALLPHAGPSTHHSGRPGR